MTGRVLTVGESMALMDPEREGPFAEGSRFTLRVAGAESNVAIGLARLGIPVAWISRLGRDDLGDSIHRALMREGVDVGLVGRDATLPTGLYFKRRAGGKTHVLYYRAGSAASALAAADVPDAALDGVALVHLTGITMALSDSACDLVRDVARRARARGITVTFDPNYRAALWRAPEAAGSAMREILPDVDWVLCGEGEGRLLFGGADAAAIGAELRRAGAGAAVVRMAGGGSALALADGAEQVPPGPVEPVLDEVGAGDAFAAGFIHALLTGASPAACARCGHLLAARALRGSGDWETLPRLAEIGGELAAISTGGR